MTTGATGQLGLALPVQGELSGTWGDTVNNGITQYTNIAIAATLTLTNDGAVTLANTTGDASASNITSTLTGAGTVTAQFAIVRVTGTLTVAKVVTAPSYSKTYTVVNAATGGIVTFKAAGQTGVSIAVGESAFVYYNGTDYVKVSSTVATGVTSFTAGTTGLTPNTATTGAVTLAGTLATTNGGTNLTSFTSGGVVYASSSSALATGSALVFDGTNLGVGASSPAAKLQLGWSLDQLKFTNPTAGTKRIGASYTGYLSGNDHAAIDLLAAGSSGGQLTFSVTPNGGSLTTAATLNLDGKLLVGSTSAPSSAAIQLLLNSSTSSGGLQLNYGAGTGGGAIVGATGAGINFFTYTGAIGSESYSERARIDSSGNFLVGGTAARGTTAGAAHLDLFNGTAPAGTLTNGVSLYSSSGDLKFMNAAGDAFDVGYRNIPQNVQTGSYTLTLADAGDHIYRGSGSAATWTIPAASSVAYPIGTAITFINLSATAVSIAITTDTMYLSSAGTTGTRTLAQYGSATAIKISGVSSSGIWLISGSGLT